MFFTIENSTIKFFSKFFLLQWWQIYNCFYLENNFVLYFFSLYFYFFILSLFIIIFCNNFLVFPFFFFNFFLGKKYYFFIFYILNIYQFIFDQFIPFLLFLFSFFTVYYIWFERNNRSFSSNLHSPENISTEILQLIIHLANIGTKWPISDVIRETENMQNP